MVQNTQWKRVAITVRPNKQGVDQIANEISQFLLDKGSQVYINGIPSDQLPENIESCPLEDLDVDLIITIGGDGTVLHAARCIRKISPIFAVNFGSRGFLAESEPSHAIEALECVFNNQYQIEENMRLSIETEKNEQFEALNEALITSRYPSKMVYLKILVDNVNLWHGFADGVIIATPTGSSAHSASAGGSLIDLRVDAVTIVFISPLDFSMRPIVVPAKSKIDIQIHEEGKEGLLVIDGQVQKPVKQGSFIRITKSRVPVIFLRLNKYSHLYRLSKLRKKLIKSID